MDTDGRRFLNQILATNEHEMTRNYFYQIFFYLR